VILGIDASNLRHGGGVTHLVELLRVANPRAHGFSQVTIWGALPTLDRVDSRPWLVKSRQPLLEKSLPYRLFWQRFRLSKLARQAGCGLLFAPGGSHADHFHPVVTMSRNMLPFEWHELRRYGWSWTSLRLLLLRRGQSRSFRRADGLVFMTKYAREGVMRIIEASAAQTTIIPHGVDGSFVCPPREQRPIGHYQPARPFRILYVSIVDLYKHQWHVAEAVAQLRADGLPVLLELVGPSYSPALARLKQTTERVDPAGRFVRYLGSVPHAELHARYAEADLCLFASSCENMPNILLEAMASGLPIACSSRGPMPEVLGDAGVYFDPETPDDIARALRELIDSPNLRTRMAQASSERVRRYSWRRCADETFTFLAEVAAAYCNRPGQPIRRP
jgi:glycosyltransferase involved in cell wall biosynthesis